MRLENVQNWPEYDQNPPKNVENQANWSQNIQKLCKLLQNSYSGKRERGRPLKSYCWSPNLLGSSCLAAATICSSAHHHRHHQLQQKMFPSLFKNVGPPSMCKTAWPSPSMCKHVRPLPYILHIVMFVWSSVISQLLTRELMSYNLLGYLWLPVNPWGITCQCSGAAQPCCLGIITHFLGGVLHTCWGMLHTWSGDTYTPSQGIATHT